jgi:hypothetical protein
MELKKREGHRGAGFQGALAIVWLAASLSACGSLNIFGGSDDSASSAAPPAPPSATRTFFQNLAMGGPEQPLPPAAPPAGQTRYPDAVTQEPDFQCPMLDVAANGASLRVYVGADTGAQALRHQIAIKNIARECKDAGSSNINMKMGVEGSVLLGPSGTPGTFTVPLVFEARLKDKVVTSRRENLSVTIPPDQLRAYFSTVVSDFAIPKDDDIELYVGLNQGADKPLQPPVRKRRQARR